jgi:hypothetical protein
MVVVIKFSFTLLFCNDHWKLKNSLPGKISKFSLTSQIYMHKSPENHLRFASRPVHDFYLVIIYITIFTNTTHTKLKCVYNASVDNVTYNEIQHFLYREILYYGYWTMEHFPLSSNSYFIQMYFEKIYDQLVVWTARAISVLIIYTSSKLTYLQ